MRVLYRADGSPDIGTGHIVRGLILRRRLEAAGLQVTFLTRDFPWGVERLRKAGCDVIVIPRDASEMRECDALREAGGIGSARICVMDALETSAAQTRAVVEHGSRLVCLDDVGPGRLHANAIINVLEVEPEPDALAERGIALYEGPDYVPLVEEYEQPGIAEREIPEKVRRILITLGGADPAGLAPKAARAVKRAFESRKAETAFESPSAVLLIGAASPSRDRVLGAIKGAEDLFTIADSLPSLLPALREADLGIIAGGLTMHEALAVGLPAIALCQPVRHQAELARRFADRGAMLTLGAASDVPEERIAQAVLSLARDFDLRRRLAAAGPRLVDGCGAERTAGVICDVGRGRPRT